MTAEERVKQEFESLKGQFVITQSHKIERLVAIGEDEHDLYWITYDGRKLTWKKAEQDMDETRMSPQVKLQRAWEREQAKSAASRKRGQELLNPPKPLDPKKDEKANA